MKDLIYYSEKEQLLSWSDAENLKDIFGKKGALLCAIPQKWTLPFILLGADLLEKGRLKISKQDKDEIERFKNTHQNIFIRCSIIGETIWDRGESPEPKLHNEAQDIFDAIDEFSKEIYKTMGNRKFAIILQEYKKASSKGEFGNLLRITYARDHWKLEQRGKPANNMMNSQRDRAYSPDESLVAPKKRMFSCIGAWTNSYLLKGRKDERVIFEWILSGNQYYLVQIDNEEEDDQGTNPFHIMVEKSIYPAHNNGEIWQGVDKKNIDKWDKLKVLKELWQEDEKSKPILFVCPFSEIRKHNKDTIIKIMETDINNLIGNKDIVIRTSPAEGKEYNLPRKTFSNAKDAARWCFKIYDEYKDKNYAFVGHKYISASSSAWVSCKKGGANIEIHSLWGSPDGLQFFPYDIFEFHVRTNSLIYFPTYKSNIIIPDSESGEWKIFRVKNELARHKSITDAQACDIAKRSHEITENIGKDCHIMWFIGCLDEDGDSFNLPWYWTEAHGKRVNLDRAYHSIFTIANCEDFEELKKKKDSGSLGKIAIELKPNDLGLIRDNQFIEEIGNFANNISAPIFFAGSVFAHVYFQLTKLGCAVVAEHEIRKKRVRGKEEYQKIVRDKIPSKIFANEEDRTYRPVDNLHAQRYLLAKLIEEALEVREASGEKRIGEYADLFEVFKALIAKDEISFKAIEEKADEKNKKMGSFEKNYVLGKTGRGEMKEDGDNIFSDLIMRLDSENSISIPFTFFGFAELKKPTQLYLGNFDPPIFVSVTLEEDKVIITLDKEKTLQDSFDY